jgi:probable HAF family extracellular repeat protein
VSQHIDQRFNILLKANPYTTTDFITFIVGVKGDVTLSSTDTFPRHPHGPPVRRLPGRAGHLALGALALLLPLVASAAAPSFTGVGDLPGGAVDSVALAISADGAVVVGQSESGTGTQAFRWTSGGGISGLGFLALGTPFSSARAISANGAVIAGSSNGSDGVRRAFRWSGGVFTALNRFTCSSCDPITEGNGVSADGLVVVGSATAKTASGPLHVDPVRWPGGGTGIIDLGNLAATQEVGEAYGASDTGTLIAGAHNSSAGRDAWYWTGSGLNVLPRLAVVTKVTAGALAVARNGTAIVGYTTNAR